MPIINPLPYNIADGQAIDAVPVMADLNQIVNNVNANAAPLVGTATQTQVQSGALITAPDTGTAGAYAMALTPPITAYTPGMLLSLQGIKASNPGASTLAVNGLAVLPIQGPGATALQGGELVAGYGALLRVNAAATAFELIQTTGGSLPIRFVQKGASAVARTVQTKLQESVSILDFGADPTGVADSTAAVNNAIAAGITSLIAPAGSYIFSGVISHTASTTLKIQGAGRRSTTFTSTNASNSSIFSASSGFIELRGITFSGAASPTGGTLLNITADHLIDDCELVNYYNGAFLGGNTGTISNSTLGSEAAQGPLSTASIGIAVNGYAGGLVIKNILGYVPTVTPFAGINIQACGAVQISDCNIIKQGTNLLINPASGKTVSSVQSVNNYFDSAQNFNIYIVPATGGSVVRSYFTQCETSSSAGNGFVIDGSAGTVDGVNITSLQSNLCATDGLLIFGTNAKNIDVIGGQCAQNTSTGISLNSSCNNVNIIGVRCGAGYGLSGNASGIYIDSTCSNIKLVGAIAAGNTSTQIVDNANSNIIGCVGITNAGYTNWGNGLIVQTGTFTSSATAAAATAVSFAKPFPTACVLVIVVANYTGTSNAATWFDSPTTTGFNGHCALATVGCSYYALGY